MPVAQRYGTRKVATDPLPDVRRTAAETSLSTGAGVAQAQGEAAQQGIGQFGSQLGNLGGQFAQVVLEERQKANLAASFEADNQLARWQAKALYDPTNGALLVRGKGAMPLPETVGAAYEKYADEVGASLKTKEQRDTFAKQRANRGTDMDLQLRRHVAGEMQQYYQGELKSVVENGTNEAIALSQSPELVGKKLEEIVSSIKTGGAKLLGMGPEEIAQAVGAAKTAVHAGVITRLIVEGQDRNAQHYFDGNKADITAGERTRLEAQLVVATTQGEGLRTSEDLWTKYGPQTDGDPIALDKMETDARAKFKDDPKTLDATIKFLRERKAGVDAARQDRKEAVQGTLWGMVAKGATLSEIQHTPEYLAAPGGLQAQVSEHVVTNAQQDADRRYMLGQRGTAEAARRENEKERAGWAMLWHYDSPEVLSQMTDNQVLALTPDLGVDHVNRLMTKKRSLIKSDETVRAATIDDEDFKTTAHAAGLPAYKTSATEDEKAGLGRLRQEVETKIDQEQQGTGKILPRARKLEIMHAAVDRKVMLDYWTGDPERVAATVISASDRKVAYVPIAKVPPKIVDEALNFIRGQSAAFQRMPEAEFRARMTSRVQHAYALRLIGGDANAIMRALNGEPDE